MLSNISARACSRCRRSRSSSRTTAGCACARWRNTCPNSTGSSSRRKMPSIGCCTRSVVRATWARARVAAIGEGTADALLRHGVVADLVPQRYVAEALVDAFPPGHRNGRVLLPRAAAARDVVPAGLRRLGWEVEVVQAYKTIPVHIAAAVLERVRLADAITFTSSSTVLGFLERAAVSDLPPIVASIGPITSATARGAGIDVSVESEVHTAAGLAEALAEFAARRPPRPSGRTAVVVF